MEPDADDRLATLERRMKEIELEWELAYDKLRTLAARYSKRAERIEQHEQQTPPENAMPTGSITDLSRLDPVSRRIIERRRRLFTPAQPDEEATG
jgi:hypothetical protein